MQEQKNLETHNTNENNSKISNSDIAAANQCERIEQLEQQLEKAKILADEQTQQMQWLSDYYKEEIEQVKAAKAT